MKPTTMVVEFDYVGVLVGGFTAGSIDSSHVLGGKLPLFIGIVVVLSALPLMRGCPYAITSSSAHDKGSDSSD